MIDFPLNPTPNVTTHTVGRKTWKCIGLDGAGRGIWDLTSTPDSFADQVALDKAAADQAKLDAQAAAAAFNTFKTDLANTADTAKGSALVAWLSSLAGSVGRTLAAKLADIPSSAKDRGALGNNAANDQPALAAQIALGRSHIPAGTYLLGAALGYKSDQLITGDGKSFAGTTLKPSGNWPALIPGVASPVKSTVRDLQIDATNVTGDFALKISNTYLTDYENIWIRNSYKGISIDNSDSITCRQVMVMEDSNNDAVLIGDNARSVRFIASNFEKNPGNNNPGGIVRINGAGGVVSEIDLIGCQWERGGLVVEKGVARVQGGKLDSSAVELRSGSRDCTIEAMLTGGSQVQDFGFNNRVRGAYCYSMATPLHEWPAIVGAAAGATTFGAAGEEWVYLATAGRANNSAAAAATIDIKEGVTVLATSPAFDLAASGDTVGLNRRPTFTFLAVVKNAAAASGPVVNGATLFGLRGGKNLLTNGTFGGALTGWTQTSITSAVASGNAVVITPATGNWGISQSLAALCKQGKRYIAVAKFSGNAALSYGQMWNGTVGARPLYSPGLTNLYGDGDTVAMLSFEHIPGISNTLSFGALGSVTAVTVRWVALIECP